MTSFHIGYDSSNYSRWVKSNIIENPYSIEGEDWTPLVTNDEPINQNVNPTKDYAITIVMAKKIAMMSKTEIGNKIRDYFIEAISIIHVLKQLVSLCFL